MSIFHLIGLAHNDHYISCREVNKYSSVTREVLVFLLQLMFYLAIAQYTGAALFYNIKEGQTEF